MRVIGYIRVSTFGQATDGVSLEAQRTRIRQYCEANEYDLAADHSDAGIFGKRADNRPGLQKALASVCGRRGGALVVYSVSRLARSTEDAIAIAEQLDKAAADLDSLSEKIGTTSAAGKMVFRMLAVLAEFERDLTAECTRSALAVKRANGERIGALLYGYDLANDGVALVENAGEQAIIGDIRAMRREGRTLKKIAPELTDRRVPTKTRESVAWTHQAIARILSP